MTAFRIRSWVVLPALVLVGAAAPLAAQSRPCATPSSLAAKQIATLRSALDATDSRSAKYVAALGLTGTSGADLTVETDVVVCTAVTDAIQAALQSAPAANNLVVLRAGSHYVALHPDGSEATLFVTTSSYGDVRTFIVSG